MSPLVDCTELTNQLVTAQLAAAAYASRRRFINNLSPACRRKVPLDFRLSI